MKYHDCRPELILFNGDFRTQDHFRPRASAVAVALGHIVAVGNDDEVKSIANSNTKFIDLEGRLGLPGMTDSHFHYYEWALGRRNLTLADVKSFKELIDRVTLAVKKTSTGGWILGQGWNESDWPENRKPTRNDLDVVAPSHPVALWRCDLHLTVINSRALELAGINEKTPDPLKGKIERDPAGRPNGILRELAINLVRAVIPEPTEDEIFKTLQEGITPLHALGLTGIHDIRLMDDKKGAAALRTWQRLREIENLNLRCWVTLPGEHIDEAIALGLRTGFGDDRLRIGHLKFFADGGMGARTAWMIEPYLDAEKGMPLIPMVELEKAIQKADRAGLAVMVHAVGDRANRELTCIFERLAKLTKPVATLPLVPHRIEHVQMIRPDDLARLAKLNINFCVQPHNMILDMNMVDEALGDKGRWVYAFRSLWDTGRPVMFSSDCPVCDPSPLVGIHAAITRQRKDGTPEDGWYPDSRVGIDEAIRSYTVIPALAHAQAHDLGSITSGKLADIVVLDRNIYSINPMEIVDTKVDLTIFNGHIVYQR